MMDDDAIIDRCRAGQTDLFALLVQRYQTPVYGLCRKLAGNETDAADLFQDTWLRALDRLHQYRTGTRFLSWLFKVCLNLYRDRYRKRGRWLRRFRPSAGDDGPEPQDPGTDPASSLIDREERAALRRAVNGLDDRYRLPVLLYYFGELSMAEIGEALDIPEGTVKSRLAEARKRLKQMLTEGKHGRSQAE